MPFWELRIGDLITVGAIVAAPFGALWAQWKLQLRQEQRNRRLLVFKTLMRTRSSVAHVDHVQALNLIDVEFASDNEDDIAIRTAWNKYLDHLRTSQGDTEESKRNWGEKRGDYLAELLHKMGQHLGYSFDFTYIKDRAYIPDFHNEYSAIEFEGKKGWMEIVTGQKPLKMEVTRFPIDEEYAAAQKELAERSKTFFEGKTELPVKVVDAPKDLDTPKGF